MQGACAGMAAGKGDLERLTWILRPEGQEGENGKEQSTEKTIYAKARAQGEKGGPQDWSIREGGAKGTVMSAETWLMAAQQSLFAPEQPSRSPGPSLRTCCSLVPLPS